MIFFLFTVSSGIMAQKVARIHSTRENNIDKNFSIIPG